MKRLIALLFVLALFSTSAIHAKRGVPAKVPLVTVGKIEYRAPASQMGLVEAWDTESNEMIWRRQIYVVKYNVDLERDVQDIFITLLRHKNKTLLVTNERKSEYELNLDTLQVKVLKGSFVETK